MIAFYRKHKLKIVAATLTLLVLLCNLKIELWPLASAFMALFYFTCSFGEQLCITTYLCAFSNVSQIYVSGLLLSFIYLCIKYCFDLKHKKKPFFRREFVLTTIIVFVFSIIHQTIDVGGFFNWGLFVALFYSIYFIFIYHDEIDVDRCFKSLFVGLVVSVLVGVCVSFAATFREIIYPFDGLVNRLRLFTHNVNQLSMFCLFEIAYLCHKILNEYLKPNHTFMFFKDWSFWTIIIQFVFCSTIGFLTLSKAFFILFMICVLYLLIYFVMKYKLKSLIVILPIFIVLALLTLPLKGFAHKLISRFSAYGEINSIWSKIFTGRTEIWQVYLDNIRSSIWTMLFGAGLLTQDPVAIGPHNVFIYFLYRVGFVGIILIISLFYCYFKDSSKTIKIRYRNCLVLICYFLLSLEEMIFSDRFFVFLVFAILMTLSPKRKIKIYPIEIQQKFSKHAKSHK